MLIFYKHNIYKTQRKHQSNEIKHVCSTPFSQPNQSLELQSIVAIRLLYDQQMAQYTKKSLLFIAISFCYHCFPFCEAVGVILKRNHILLKTEMLPTWC